MFYRSIRGTAIAAAILGVMIAQPAMVQGQAYPSKVTRVISCFAAGGTNDLLSRAMARKLEAALGHPFVVENRTGANGMIGADFVAKNPGDSYVLLMGNGATHGSNPTLYPNIPYDAVKDFTPVGMVGVVPVMLIASSTLPVKSVQELVAYAKEHPRTLSYGSSGVGGTAHIAGEKFKRMTGLDITHAPYRGDALAAQDVLAGQIPLAFLNITSVISQLKSGRMRVLAVASAKRSPSIPDVPTFAEAGVKEMEFSSWFGLMGPAGMPKDVVAKLNAEITKAVKSPDMQQTFAAQGTDPATAMPDEFAIFVKSEIVKYGKAIKELDIRVE